jgi:hypothetical protein
VAKAKQLATRFSLGNLFEDLIVDREVRHRPTQPGILDLHLFQLFHLVDAQATVLPGAIGKMFAR